ncbi:MAG: tRNA pseudouridine(38-40) synthase TruA [Clostridiales bacterium]|jgi:tRNA pseudouridine38-40 synthase|nr:tRNA pseudouridine(38-40) synthase TruA [Clostridiales bacterium]
MHNYKLTIQYDGGRYKGWQRLGNTNNTIQGKIEYVLSELMGEEIEIIGSSRTDAGVHALGQIANFKTNKNLSTTKIQEYLNHYLPQDISIIRVDKVSENFHARYHARAKTYLYRIWNREYSHPFMRKYSMHIEEKLDLEAMKKAAGYFVGTHDFTAFSNAKSKKKSMVREIYSFWINQEDGFVDIRIRGNGFLYNMARWIAGTLIDVGLGDLDGESIPTIIQSKKRDRTGRLAEPQGLYLENIEYEEFE